MAAKVLALQATEAFINEKKPTFDVINIHPGYIVGRDDTVTEAASITKGTNGLAFGQLLGKPAPYLLTSTMVHLDDVARLHVESLDTTKIAGNQSFLAVGHGLEGPTWGAALDILKRRYPKEVAEGVFKVDGGAAQTSRMLVDCSYTEKTFGFTFKTYEEQIISVAEHFLELLGRK
jgi:nucleoside-diphosphate-sugar epimerase